MKEEFKPVKDIWYNYISYDKCGEKELRDRKLPIQSDWECWEIRPHVLIGDKKIRAKFKVIENKCIIFINGKEKVYPLLDCEFSYATKYYHHKQIDPKKRKDKEGFTMTPSNYGEYYVYVRVMKEI